MEISPLLAAIMMALAIWAGTSRQYSNHLYGNPLNTPSAGRHVIKNLVLLLVVIVGSFGAAIYAYQWTAEASGSRTLGALAAAVTLYVRYFVSARRAFKSYINTMAAVMSAQQGNSRS